MQQIPAYDEVGNRYRNCFMPTVPGWVFVDSDYSSQELVIIAYISQDPVWLDALAKGKDLHSVCAHMMYGKKWENATEAGCEYFAKNSDEELKQKKCSCKKHKVMRYDTKTIDFGLAYGMSKFKLAGELKITVPEAEALIDLYFTTFPNIGKVLTNLGGYGVQTGLIKTLAPFNRKRWFPNWEKVKDRIEYHIKGIQYNGILGEIERASKNMPIQGSSGDMTKYALTLIRRYINDHNLRDKVHINMQVHDQITTECHPDFAEEWMPIFTGLMEKAAKLIIPSGILKAESAISPTWTK
jgi:DNA polymerase I